MVGGFVGFGVGKRGQGPIVGAFSGGLNTPKKEVASERFDRLTHAGRRGD